MSKYHDTENPHSVEEKINALTHSMGAGMSIVGLVILLMLIAINKGGPLTYFSFIIYGVFQIFLYISSSLTHQFVDMPGANKAFRLMDQIGVFLLIGGSYTPVVLLVIGGSWGWIFFGIVWGLAVLGILSKVLLFKGDSIFSDLLHLPLGWLIVFMYKPFSAVAPAGLFSWIILGGILYTVGIVFYVLNMWKKVPMTHVVWHLFVLAGSIAFYIGFVKYLI